MDYNGIGFSNKSIDKLTKKQKYIAKAVYQSVARLDFGESAAGGWQLAAGVVRPPGGVGRR